MAVHGFARGIGEIDGHVGEFGLAAVGSRGLGVIGGGTVGVGADLVEVGLISVECAEGTEVGGQLTKAVSSLDSMRLPK